MTAVAEQRTPADYARALWEEGLHVIPLQARGKTPRLKQWKPYQDRAPTEQEVEQWARMWPDANYAVLTGAQIVVVDADSQAAAAWVEANITFTPRRTRTAKGKHYWFQPPSAGLELKTKGSDAAPIDFRGTGGYVVAPGSVHATGVRYTDERVADWGGTSWSELPRLTGDDITAIERYNLQACGRPAVAPPPAPPTATGVTPETVTELQSALQAIGADAYDTWVEVGQALHDAGLFDLWDTWSQPSSKYPGAEAMRAKWGSFHAGGGLTYRSIFQQAQANGWRNPRKAEPKANSDERSDKWRDPRPLPQRPDVQAFDLDLLPASLRGWVADVAARMNAPPDYPAVAAMTVLSVVVGCKLGIRPMRLNDWQVVANLWGVIIGRPSVKKSPALRAALEALRKLAANARAEFEQAAAQHTASAKVAAASVKALDGRIRDAVKKGDIAEAERIAIEAAHLEAAIDRIPTERRYITNDVTVQKLAELLVENPNGLFVFADELIGLLKSLEKEGQEESRAFYLAGWDGSSGHQYDRIGRGSGYVPRVCLSVLGGIQPGPFNGYVASALANGGGADGLLQRFQLMVWPDDPPPYVHLDTAPDQRAWERAWDVYQQLDEIPATSPDDDVPHLHFDDSAQPLFDAWYTDLQHRLPTIQIEAYESHLAKYGSLAPSLALLIQLADEPHAQRVTKPALERAIAWCAYLETHAARVYSMYGPLSHAHALAKRWKDLPAEFTARDIYNNNWSLLDKAGSEVAITELEARGWLTTVEIRTSGRPKTIHRRNPRVDGLLP